MLKINTNKGAQRVAILAAASDVSNDDGEFYLTEALRHVSGGEPGPYDLTKWSEDLQVKGLIVHRGYHGHFMLTENGRLTVLLTR